MRIQNLLLPKFGVCAEESLFFYRESYYDREVIYNAESGELQFQEYGWCDFGSYFNGLSIAKWKKYTTIGDVSLCLWLQGKFEVTLVNAELVNQDVYTHEVDKFYLEAEERTLFTLPYKLYEYKGILSFTLRALADGAVYSGGWYDAEVEEEALHPVNIAIDICTFKREPYVFRNLEILKKSILEDPESELYGHLRVYVQDNAQSLPREQLESESVRIVPNKNVGGAGGFTRGLIEIMEHTEEYPATHALLMDDDIVIEPESLFRTYMLLRCRKEKYRDLFIGGAMLRSDDQTMQVESGASWNAGKLISNKSGLRMNLLPNCLFNEVEEYTEFNAWWYCCIPMDLVSDTNLPLPIFIRGDDLEYGLRNMKYLLLLNGICVWHEAFENKYSSYLQYYILRNLLYDNSIHFPEYSLFAFLKQLYRQVARELLFYRYKNVDLIFRGVRDFYKGVDFLKTTDGEALHKEIMAAGYKAVPVDEIPGAVYRTEVYLDSLENQKEPFRHKLFRLLTLNGYLLPAKKRKSREMQVVSMALCRPSNFFRQKEVLNYDSASAKGFVTRKSYKKLFACLWGLFVLTLESIVRFPASKRNFRARFGELTNKEAWEAYLGLNTQKGEADDQETDKKALSEDARFRSEERPAHPAAAG